MRVRRIGDLFTISKGKKYEETQGTDANELVRYIQIEDLRNDKNIKMVNRNDNGVYVTNNDVLIAWDGANAGTVGYNLTGIIGSTIAVLRTLDSNNYIPYIAMFLQSKSSFIRENCTGATIPHVQKKVLENIEVPVPSYNQQKQIAYILDRAQTLIGKRKDAIAKLDELVQAVFLELFGDLRVNSKNWSSVCLSEIAEVASGITKGKKYNDTELVSVPYMRVANVQDGYVDLSEIKEIEVSHSDAIRYRLQSRDVLLTEGGDPDKLGRGAVWNAPISDCIHQNHIFRVRVNEDILNPYFFSACAGSDYGKNYFLRMAKQTTGIATINMTQLKGFSVFLPPIELQNRYEQLVENIDVKKQQMKLQLQQLESNFQALLQKAFKGELTMKDGVTV